MVVVKTVVAEMMSQVVVTDTRLQAKVVYPLLPTVFAIIICWCGGCNNCVEISDFWEANHDFLLENVPNLPCQPVSHDTINRLVRTVRFSDLNDFLVTFCTRLIESKRNSSMEPRILALDGQTPGSIEYEPKKDPQGNLYMDRRAYNKLYYVTLQDTTNRLSLAQTEVQDKENENKACERLVKMFFLENCIVTTDALNTQRPLAELIIKQEGDYCMAVKDNHKTLCQGIKKAFDEHLDEAECYKSEAEKAHGRVEQRTVFALPVSLLTSRVLGEWKEDAETIFMAITESTIVKYKTKRENEVRFFISSVSFDTPDIAKIGYRAIRSHRGIENSLHWVLDMDYGQDLAQMKNRDFIKNRLVLNKLSLNIVRIAQKKLQKGAAPVSVARARKILGYKPELILECMTEYFINEKGELAS